MNAASARRLRSSASRALPSVFRRPETTRRAPSLAKAMAVARPMPVRAPVIKTTGLFMALLLERRPARDGLAVGHCEEQFADHLVALGERRGLITGGQGIARDLPG